MESKDNHATTNNNNSIWNRIYSVQLALEYSVENTAVNNKDNTENTANTAEPIENPKCQLLDGKCVKCNKKANLTKVRRKYRVQDSTGNMRWKYRVENKWICSETHFWLNPSQISPISPGEMKSESLGGGMGSLSQKRKKSLTRTKSD